MNRKNKWHVSVHKLLLMLLENERISNDEIKMNKNIKRAIFQMKGASERISKLYDKYLFKNQIILDGILSLGHVVNVY